MELKQDVAVVGKLVRRRGRWVEDVGERYAPDDFDQPTPIGLRRRTGKRPPMGVTEKIKVVHQVLVEREFQTVVAREHRISNASVSMLVKKAVKNRQFIDELMQMENEKQKKVDVMVEVIGGMNSRYTFIDSAASVAKLLEDDHEMVAKPREVVKVMRDELGMRYRKVKSVSLTANSERNLVLRQQFAMEMIAILQEKKIILNLDETWLGMTDFRRMKWRVKGSRNSISKAQVAPRISMMVGLDTLGHVYLSLYQSNSNSKMIEIFLNSLVKKLDRERTTWREDTVLLWDNAPYHTSPATLKTLRELQIPVLFTGPYSYDASPCELWFAHFKKKDINPRHVKTGKRQVP